MSTSFRPLIVGGRAALFGVLCGLLLPAIRAQTSYYWDGAGSGTVAGGAGVWDTTLTRWSATASGSTYQAWTNGSNAVFQNTPGTVTLDGPVTTNALTFGVSGYTIATSNSSALTLSGAGTIAIGTFTAAISAPIAGTAGLDLTGTTGTLTLSGVESYTGATTVSGGTLSLGTTNQLSSLSAVQVNGGTLALGATSQTVGTVTLSSGSITGSTGTLTSTGNFNVSGGSISASLAGSGSLNLSGSGTITLTGTNSYTGGTTLSGATVNFNSIKSFGTGPIDFSAGGTLKWATGNTADISSQFGALDPNGGTIFDTNGNNVAFATPLTGGANAFVTKNGAGTLTLAAGGTYGFGVYVTGGTIAIAADSALGAVPAETQPDSIELSAGTLETTASLTIASTRSTQIDQAGGTIQTDAGTTLTYAGVVSNNPNQTPGLLTKTGAGTLVLSGQNTFTGGFTITGGLVDFSALDNLGSGAANTITLNGGGLQWATGNTLDLTSAASFNRTLGANGATFDTNGNAVQFSAALSGAGGLTKAGAGTLTLSVANSFTGGVTLDAGALALGNPGSLGSGALTLAGGTLDDATTAALTLSTNNAQTWSGDFGFAGTGNLNLGTGAVTLGASPTVTVTANTLTIAGAINGGDGYGLTKAGAGTLALTGANTFSGGLTVAGGLLQIDTSSNASALNAATPPALAFSGSGTLQLLSSSTTAARTTVVNGLTLSAGAAEIDVDRTGTQNLTLDLRGTGGTAGITRAAGSTVDFKATTGTFGTNAIVETNQANMNGILGAWATVNGTNWAANNGSGLIVAYTAYTTPTGANPTIASSAAANERISSASTGNVTLAATGTTSLNTLLINDPTARTIDLRDGATAGTLLFGATGGILTTGGADTIGVSGNAGTITAGGTGNTAGELIVNTGSALTINSVIANNGTGVVSLTKSGASTLTLAGANTFTGATVIDAGSITLANSLALQDSTLTAPASGALSFGALTSATLGGLTGSNNLSLTNASSAAVALTVGGDNAGTTYSGVFSGAGSLVKTGTGTLTLSGTETYTGATTINGGTLALTSSAALSSATDVTLANASGATLTLASSQTIGSLAGGGASGGNVTLGTATLTTTDNLSTTFAGSISGTGGSFVKFGTGTLTLSGANTFTGPTTITGGSITLANPLALQDSTVTATGSGALSFGALTSATLGGLTGSNNLSLTNASSAAVALTVGGDNASTTYSGVFSGAGSLVKTGSGTLTLSGTETYTGATTINGGTLALTSSAALSSTAAVSLADTAGATLALSANESVGSLSGGGAAGGTIALGATTLTIGGDNTSTTFAGSFSGTGGSLVKTGTGLLTLTGTSTYSGGTNISTSGVPYLGGVEFNSLANFGSGNLTLTNYGNLVWAPGSTTDLSSRLAGNVSAIFDTNGNNVIFATAITGTGIEKIGAGTLTLASGSTLGSVIAIDGTISTPSLGGSLLIFYGGTIDYAGSSTTAQIYAIPGDPRNVGGEFDVATSGQTVTFADTGNPNTNGLPAMTFGGAGNVVLPVDFTSVASLTKNGGGTLTLTGGTQNTGIYSAGPITVNDGTLSVSAVSSVADSRGPGYSESQLGYFSTGSVTLGSSTTAGTLSYTGASSDFGYAFVLGAGGGELDVTTAGQTLTFSSSAGISGAGAFTFGGAGSAIIPGSLTQTGGLIKDGAGTLTLSGANTFAGATTVNGGTLALSGGAALPNTSAVNLANTSGVTLALSSSESIGSLAGGGSSGGNVTLGANTLTTGFNNTATSFSGVISGSGGSLTKVGSNTFSLSTTETYTGGTAVDGGTLALNFAGLGTPTNLISSSSTLTLGGGTLNVTGKPFATTSQTFAGTTIASGASAVTRTPAGTSATNVALGALTRNVGGTVDFTASGNGNITTTAAAANGILGGWATVGGTNWASVSGGNIVAATYTANTWGSGLNTNVTASATVGSGSTTNSLRFATSGSQTLTLSGTDTIASGGILVTTGVGANTTTITGGTLIGASGADLVVIDNNPSGSLALASAIADNGSATGLTKSGTGTLTLSGANSYSGATTLNAGTLSLASGSALGNTATLTFAGGTLQSTSSNTLDTSALIANSTGPIAIDTNGQTVIFASPLGSTNTGGLTKSGTGSLILTGADSYSGATTLNGGTLILAGAAALPEASPLSLANTAGATLSLNASETIGSLAGGGTSGGSVALNSNTLTTGANNASTTFAGAIGGGGSLVKLGSGTLTLTGANTYGGATAIEAGTLAVSGGAALPDTSAVALANTAGVTLALSTSETVGSLAGGGAAGGNVTLGATTLTTGADGTSTTFAGVISGTGGSLVKSGPGTFILTGANTYTGTTTINGGTLQVDTGGSSATLGLGAVADNGSLVFDRNDHVDFSQAISGSGSLTQAGSGVLILFAADTYTGATTVSGGTLSLNFAELGTPTNLLSSSSALVLDGGTLDVTGQNGSALTSQTLASTTINVGASAVTRTPNGSTATNLALGAITRNVGGTVDFSAPGDGNLTTTSAATNGILGGWATVGGSDWATVSGGAITAATYTNDAWGAGINTNVTASATLAAASTTNSVRFAAPGAQTLTLSGSNTITSGGILVTSGVGAHATTMTGGTLAGASGADLVVIDNNPSGSLTIASVIANNGAATGLTVAGTGTLILTGADTYTGVTTIGSGTLQIGSGASAGALGAGAVINQAALVFDLSTDKTVANSISGPGSLTQSGSNTITLTGTNTYTGTTTVGSGGTLALDGTSAGAAASAFNLSASSTYLALDTNASIGSLTGNGVVQLGTSTLMIGGDNTSTGFLGQITGSGGGLTKTGTGTLTLNGTLTYTGATTINGGTLALSDTTLPDTSVTLANTSGATLELTKSQTLADLAGGGASGGNVMLGGGVALTTGGDGTSTTFAGALSGAGSLVKAGGGTFTLSGANTTTGGATISAGTLQFAQQESLDNAVTSNWTAANLIVNAGAIAAFNVGGPGEFTAANLATLSALGTSTGGFLNGSYLGLDTTHAAGGVFTYNGNLVNPNGGANALGLVKLGTGTLILGGVNTYSGTTLVDQGSLELGSATALSPNTTLQVAAGASFEANGFQETFAALNGSGATDVGSAGIAVQPSGSDPYSGQVTGAGGLTVSGSGTLTLNNGSDNYTGATTVSSGILQLGADGALPSGTPVSVSAGAKLDLNGHAASVSQLSGMGSITNGGASLTVSQSVNTTFGGALSGAGGLTKTGTGTLVITGTNTYSGPTAIDAGQVSLNGSAANSAFSVNSGGTLSGSGTVGTLMIANGGMLSPGNSPGTLNAGATTFAGGGSYTWQINQATGGIAGGNPGWDLFNVTGALTITATGSSKFTIDVTSLTLDDTAGNATNFSSGTSYSFALVTTAAGISGFSASDFTLDTSGFANPASGTWSIAQSGDALDLNYTASAIPEPSACAAIAGAAALLFACWRRRRPEAAA